MKKVTIRYTGGSEEELYATGLSSITIEQDCLHVRGPQDIVIIPLSQIFQVIVER